MELSKLIAVYIKIRDKKAELADQIKQLEEQQKILEADLIVACREESGKYNKLSTDCGTVSVQEKQTIWTQDWDAFHKFALAEQNLEFFERRISQKNMAEFLDKNPDKKPEGLMIDRKLSVHVTRPRNS